MDPGASGANSVRRSTRLQRATLPQATGDGNASSRRGLQSDHKDMDKVDGTGDVAKRRPSTEREETASASQTSIAPLRSSSTTTTSGSNYVSVGTQTPNAQLTPYTRYLWRYMLELYPGEQLSQYSARLSFIRKVVKEHQAAEKAAHEEYHKWLRHASNPYFKFAHKLPQLHNASKHEAHMLKAALEIQEDLRRDWLLIQPARVEFFLFQKFPSEIRVRIWRMSLEPRVIEVRPTGHQTLDQDRLLYPNQPPHHTQCRLNPYGNRVYRQYHSPYIGKWLP